MRALGIFRRRQADDAARALALCEALAAVLAATWTIRPNRTDDGPFATVFARMPGVGKARMTEESKIVEMIEARWPALTAEDVERIFHALAAAADRELALWHRSNPGHGPRTGPVSWAERAAVPWS